MEKIRWVIASTALGAAGLLSGCAGGEKSAVSNEAFVPTPVAGDVNAHSETAPVVLEKDSPNKLPLWEQPIRVVSHEQVMLSFDVAQAANNSLNGQSKDNFDRAMSSLRASIEQCAAGPVSKDRLESCLFAYSLADKMGGALSSQAFMQLRNDVFMFGIGAMSGYTDIFKDFARANSSPGN